MENIEDMAKAVVVINGVEYDASAASEEAMALIQDLGTVQTEMQRIKISYDIAAIARQSLLGNISNAIASGESGLVVIETPEDTPEVVEA